MHIPIPMMFGGNAQTQVASPPTALVRNPPPAIVQLTAPPASQQSVNLPPTQPYYTVAYAPQPPAMYPNLQQLQLENPVQNASQHSLPSDIRYEWIQTADGVVPVQNTSHPQPPGSATATIKAESQEQLPKSTSQQPPEDNRDAHQRNYSQFHLPGSYPYYPPFNSVNPPFPPMPHGMTGQPRQGNNTSRPPLSEGAADFGDIGSSASAVHAQNVHAGSETGDVHQNQQDATIHRAAVYRPILGGTQTIPPGWTHGQTPTTVPTTGITPGGGYPHPTMQACVNPLMSRFLGNAPDEAQQSGPAQRDFITTGPNVRRPIISHTAAQLLKTMSIPKFSGHRKSISFQYWKRLLEECCYIAQLPMREWKLVARLSLTGFAREKLMTRDPSHELSYDATMQLLNDEYGDHTGTSAVLNFFKLEEVSRRNHL